MGVQRVPDEECYCCGYGPVVVNVYMADTTRGGGGRIVKAETKMCDLCYGTHAGSAYNFPGQRPDADAMAVICNIGNRILAAIKAPRPPGQGEAK